MKIYLGKTVYSKKSTRFGSVDNSDINKTQLELSKIHSKVQSLISKDLREELMPAMISLTKRIINSNKRSNFNRHNLSTSNNQKNDCLAKSPSTSFIRNKTHQSGQINDSLNLYYSFMIQNSLMSISKQIVNIHNYIKLNQSDRIRQIIANESQERRRFAIGNTSKNDSIQNICNNHHIIDEYDIGNQTTRKTIDQLYKEAITKKKRTKQLFSFSTQTQTRIMTSLMQSKNQMQMDFNSQRQTPLEETFIHINKVKLKPMMPSIISRNVYDYLYNRNSPNNQKDKSVIN